jgi:hypothetical protein
VALTQEARRRRRASEIGIAAEHCEANAFLRYSDTLRVLQVLNRITVVGC